MLMRRSFIPRSPFTEKPLEIGSRKWLIWQLDIHTSRIVRHRDGKCVTCGSRFNLQCSHFYSRQYIIIRFDLRNCNAMCGRCNKRHNTDPFPYLNYMQEHYGSDLVAELHALRMSLCKMMDEELMTTLIRYKAMV